MSEVNLLGLDEFGQNPGLNQLAGVGIAGGLAVAAWGAASYGTEDPSWQQRAGWLGLGAGLAASAVMGFMPATRAAGVAGAATTLLTMLPMMLIKKMGAGTAGWGVPVINQLGLPQINQINGLGIATAIPTPMSYGTVPGVAGLAQPSSYGPPVSLLGPASARQAQAQMIAGPTLQAPHGLANAYGANLFSAA
jgi:hypothetical protein